MVFNVTKLFATSPRPVGLSLIWKWRPPKYQGTIILIQFTTRQSKTTKARHGGNLIKKQKNIGFPPSLLGGILGAVCLSVCLSVCLFVCLSLCLFVRPSIYLSANKQAPNRDHTLWKAKKPENGPEG